jgi:hypothetical protein
LDRWGPHYLPARYRETPRQRKSLDYETYDKDSNSSDADYTGFVEWLSNLTATELRGAKGDPEKQTLALCWYYKRGERANLTAGELIDFLGVSSPSILGKAGYTDEEGDAVMEISDAITDDDLDGTLLSGMA